MSWLGRGGKDINFTQGGVGEDPRKEVGKKSPTWQVYVKEGERRLEKRSPFWRLQGRLDKRKDVWRGRKGIRLPFPFWRFSHPLPLFLLPPTQAMFLVKQQLNYRHVTSGNKPWEASVQLIFVIILTGVVQDLSWGLKNQVKVNI